MEIEPVEKWDLTDLLARYKATVWEQYITHLVKYSNFAITDQQDISPADKK